MKSGTDRILIIDDNEMNRDMLARRLSRKGFEISTAETARGLDARIDDEKPDLVLMDIEMPEISGIEALASIRKKYSPIQLPVIMVTARNHSDDIVRALEIGANDYLTKPVDFPVALARIRTQLSYKRAEQALRESEERYALAARGANDGLWDWNLVNDTFYFSPRWKAMLGYEEDGVGESRWEWFNRVHEADQESMKRSIEAHIDGASTHFETEARMRHRDGTYRWMLIRGIMVRDSGGKPVRMAGSQTDITEGKVADPLTGLPNRLLFLDRLLQLIEHHKRHPEVLFAVLFLDLDGFKMVNDSLGHVAGDKLLVGVGNRLVRCLRQSDTVTRLSEAVTVARLGGDEFAILVNDLRSPSDVTAIADRLMRELAEPFRLEDKEVFTSVTIGIAVSNLDYQHPEDLLRDADIAMYRAKALGKSRYEIFDAEMRASVTNRLQLETDLRHGVERQEFQNFYQPIVSLQSGAIVGFEALLRWQHPTRGMVQPGEFIPVAEETGLIRELGWWALSEACRQLAEWRGLSPHYAELTMSVNLSVKQFLQPGFAEHVAELLRKLQLKEGALKLEVTESSIMTDPVAAVNLLGQLKALGVRLAIDDFGTGYSSLSYLQRFPLDTLKIDRSFTSAITSATRNGQKEEAIIMRSIMPLANSLGLDVVAEGVETNEQVEFLMELQCKYAQGFFFSRPIAAEDAQALLLNPTALPEMLSKTKAGGNNAAAPQLSLS